MLKFLFLIGISFLTITCSDTPTNFNEVELDKEFYIKVGDSAVFASQGLVIKFNSVEDDSRCPKGAVCVWEGNAAIVLELKNSLGDTLTSNLNTTIHPKAVNFSNFIIGLKSLTPYPKLDEAINYKDYVASLLVIKKDN